MYDQIQSRWSAERSRQFEMWKQEERDGRCEELVERYRVVAQKAVWGLVEVAATGGVWIYRHDVP